MFGVRYSFSGESGDDVAPWDHLETYIEQLQASPLHVAASTAALASWVSASPTEDFVPAMPCVRSATKHRVKNRSGGHRPVFNAAVARPVGKKEISEQLKAQSAMSKEWDRLRERKVWDESYIREWSKVAAEAQRLNK